MISLLSKEELEQIEVEWYDVITDLQIETGDCPDLAVVIARAQRTSDIKGFVKLVEDRRKPYTVKHSSGNLEGQPDSTGGIIDVSVEYYEIPASLIESLKAELK